MPAGDPDQPYDYVYKVRLNGSWTENYGDATFGVPDGNIPLAIDQHHPLRFTYDHDTHRVTVGPGPAGGWPDATPTGRWPATACARTSPARTSTSSWPTASRTATPPTTPRPSTGTRLEHGFDPTSQGFYHGGDLKGIIERLDYIEGLGTTAIWMTPSFKNKPVQGEPGSESAGYHGYWITDFTQIDPHLGTNAELEDPHRPRPRARHEGLLRHHHQPHGRRPGLPGVRLRRHRAGAVQDQGGAPRTRTPRATRSTTATSPSSATPSPRSTPR